MYICKVCGKEYDDSKTGMCPRCEHVPDDFVIGGAAPSDPEVYRRALLKSLEIGLELYAHHAEGDVVAQNKEKKRIVFGNAADLGACKSITWLPDELCAVLDRSTFEVQASIYKNGRLYTDVKTNMKALPQHRLLQVGVEVNPEKLSFRIHIRNSEAETESAWLSLLRER